MRVTQILNQVTESCLPVMHEKRLRSVVACAEAVIKARKLTPAAVGRALPGRPKHGIKRVDRLLGNSSLHVERWVVFQSLAHHLLTGNQQPVIAVDWTNAVGTARALVAAVAVDGRAISILVQVHPEAKLGNAVVQKRFLQLLKRVIPAECVPVIVSDAGFHGPFFKTVRKLGWHFLGRIRGTAKARPIGGGTPTSKEQFYARATTVPTALGGFSMYSTKARSVQGFLVLVRKRRSLKKGPPPRNKEQREYRKTCLHPWLLFTSLDDSAAAVVAKYAKRMQIEETFRDAKNYRFGWAFRAVRSSCHERMATLLLLAALATYAVTVVGRAAETLGAHAYYRANTVAHRVLSLFVLGCEVIHRHDELFLRPDAWPAALIDLRRAARE